MQGAAFVFVCSSDSLASEICALELGHAVANKKRVIPIVCRDIDAAQAPAAVAKVNWIFMRDGLSASGESVNVRAVAAGTCYRRSVPKQAHPYETGTSHQRPASPLFGTFDFCFEGSRHLHWRPDAGHLSCSLLKRQS